MVSYDPSSGVTVYQYLTTGNTGSTDFEMIYYIIGLAILVGWVMLND